MSLLVVGHKVHVVQKLELEYPWLCDGQGYRHSSYHLCLEASLEK